MDEMLFWCAHEYQIIIIKTTNKSVKGVAHAAPSSISVLVSNTEKGAFKNTLSAVSSNAWRNKQNNCHLQTKFAPKRENQRCVFE